MQWRVGLRSGFGRMMAEVKKSGLLYLYLFFNEPVEVEDLNEISPIHWRERSVAGRYLANQVEPDHLLLFLKEAKRYDASRTDREET